MKNFFYSLIFIFTCSIAIGQVGRSVVGKSVLYIGQQTALTYIVETHQNEKLPFVPQIKEIQAYRIHNRKEIPVKLELIQPFSDTIIKEKGKQLWVGGYKITAWDSGYIKIPEVRINWKNKQISFPEIILKVELEKHKQGIELYDIHEAFDKIPQLTWKEKIKEFSQKYYWIGIILLLILLLFFLWKFLKKRGKSTEKQISNKLSLEDELINEIENLYAKSLWNKGELKTHYVELSHLVKKYYAKKFDLHLLEKTSYETLLLLKQKGLTPSILEELNKVLNWSDMVKFAQSEPAEQLIIEQKTRIISFIKG